MQAATTELARPRGWRVGDYAEFDRDTLVWVDDTGLWAYNRASANRDGTAEAAAFDLWEHFRIPAGTRLTITNVHGDALQVELLDGPLAGRRGWHDYGTLLKRR
jgi:hypothetical protein